MTILVIVEMMNEDFQAVMGLLTKWHGPGSDYAWWLGTWTVVVAILSVRMWLEMRHCVPAIVTLTAALWGEAPNESLATTVKLYVVDGVRPVTV